MKYNVEERLETTVRTLSKIINSDCCSITNVERMKSDDQVFSHIKGSTKFKKVNGPIMIDDQMSYYWYRCEFDVDKADSDTSAYFMVDMPSTVQEGMLKRFGLNYYGGRHMLMQDAKYEMKPQGLVYINNRLTQAFDINHREVKINKNGHYELYLYLFTDHFENPYEINFLVNYCDKRVEKAYYDFLVLLESIELIMKNDRKLKKYYSVIDNAINMIDFRTIDENLYSSLEAACDYLAKNYFKKFSGCKDYTLNCIGHSHIDMAWLWDLEQTRHKSQRTFATVLKLMEEYPEYKFIHTSPQLFAYLKKDNPNLYRRIKKRVRDGRFEVDGAAWVEPDCNLTSGESLVRQIMYGKEFISKEFGIDSKILFLPDVFGYAFQIPQILQKCGVTKFVTAKIGWSDTNRFPMDTFMWKGLDGSEVFTYLISTCTANPRAGVMDTNGTSYNGNIIAPEIMGTWNRFQSKKYSDVVMTTYGFGDGGGGPTRNMLEKQRRYAYGLPALGSTKTAGLAETLDEIEENFRSNCKRYHKTPTWSNELYLEYHRGTYTSVPWIKYKNRKTEFLLQNAELVSAITAISQRKKYRQKEIEESYKLMLLNQFHDILPGSAINKVYEDAALDYEEIENTIEPILQDGLNSIAQKYNSQYLAFNPNSFECNAPVFVGGKCFVVRDVPSVGVASFEPKPSNNTIEIEEKHLSNDYFDIVFNDFGEITSLIDKRLNKQLVAKGDSINKFVAYEDIPYRWHNWEVSLCSACKPYHMNEPAKFSVVNQGDRRGFRIERLYANSIITQRVYLYNGLDRIDIINHVEWNEKRQLVKVHFPLNIRAKQARFDVQFGSIGRNTTPKNSFDEAKFEVCGQKWVDMSNGKYGVALLNDCKYGHSVNGNDLAITCFKSAGYPNGHASDIIPDFTFSLYPHTGSYQDSNVAEAGYLLNRPPIMIKNSTARAYTPVKDSYIFLDQEGVFVDTVKKANKGNDYIFRLFEAQGRERGITLNINLPLKHAWLCDLLENEIDELEVEKGKIQFNIKPFEIITIKISKK